MVKKIEGWYAACSHQSDSPSGQAGWGPNPDIICETAHSARFLRGGFCIRFFQRAQCRLKKRHPILPVRYDRRAIVKSGHCRPKKVQRRWPKALTPASAFRDNAVVLLVRLNQQKVKHGVCTVRLPRGRIAR